VGLDPCTEAATIAKASNKTAELTILYYEMSSERQKEERHCKTTSEHVGVRSPQYVDMIAKST
jgi:hypothetical protein